MKALTDCIDFLRENNSHPWFRQDYYKKDALLFDALKEIKEVFEYINKYNEEIDEINKRLDKEDKEIDKQNEIDAARLDVTEKIIGKLFKAVENNFEIIQKQNNLVNNIASDTNILRYRIDKEGIPEFSKFAEKEG